MAESLQRSHWIGNLVAALSWIGGLHLRSRGTWSPCFAGAHGCVASADRGRSPSWRSSLNPSGKRDRAPARSSPQSALESTGRGPPYRIFYRGRPPSSGGDSERDGASERP